jgi:hypothetical protein
MRSKNVRRSAREPAPPPTSRSAMGPGRWALLVVALLALGASFAVIVDRLVASGSSASPSPSSALVSPSAEPSASPAASGSPAASPSPAAPVLEAMMPTSLDGTALTTDSATDAATLGSGPGPRALGAAVKSLGQDPTTLEIAAAYDPTGALTITILGFRVPGLTPDQLQPAVMSAWLAADTPGVTTSTTTLSGYPTTKVSYSDGGDDEYVFTYKDALIVIETSDATLAAKAAAAVGTGSSATPVPSGSTAPSGSTTPSASPSSSASPAPSPSPS